MSLPGGVAARPPMSGPGKSSVEDPSMAIATLAATIQKVSAASLLEELPMLSRWPTPARLLSGYPNICVCEHIPQHQRVGGRLGDDAVAEAARRSAPAVVVEEDVCLLGLVTQVT